jgi:uncharacterized membrane protein (DUF4010 family)
VMMLRVLVIVGVLNIALLPPLAAPLILGAIALAAIAGYLASWGHEDCPVGKPLVLRNPFELRVVLEFGALLALIMAAAKLLSGWAGSSGTMLAGVSGFVDVYAISISLARLDTQGLAPDSAAWAILVAVLANSLAKVVLGIAVGGVKFGKVVARGIAASVAVAALGLLPALLM